MDTCVSYMGVFLSLREGHRKEALGLLASQPRQMIGSRFSETLLPSRE